MRMLLAGVASLAFSEFLIDEYGIPAGLVLSACLFLAFVTIYCKRRHAAGACLIAFACLWMALQFVGPYTSLKNRVRFGVGVDRLQHWAIDTLDNPPPLTEIGPPGAIALKHLPDDIRTLAKGFCVVVPARQREDEHILFACGGGHYHWGLMVGRPGFVPDQERIFRFEKIADGVWGCFDAF
jgi:hypothetical protein